ncbi:hypothetical protein ACFFSH_39940 [Streptomyces filamentosus]|uniref:Uncharacterized protein n=1 Tax=Streptomyces filamentosus TaxID=67294 RepID=A0A919BQM8_STRFL|nr:hypothetical protein [Streptomyces filamentosus]GHG05040.1 hypothetical protein GCM10017667_39660 [Streptomyces filamentosus]
MDRAAGNRLGGQAHAPYCPGFWRSVLPLGIGNRTSCTSLDAEVEDARNRATVADPHSEEAPAEPALALSEELLLACLPALCLPELVELSNPQVTARRTLHHIANRVRINPRLATLAADRLHAAADALVARGRLLSPSERTDSDRSFDSRLVNLAEDLALLSGNPEHLA